MSELDSIIESKPVLTPHERMDIAEAFVLQRMGGTYRPLGGTLPQAPLTHEFVPGMYIRTIFMPANHVVTTYVHKQEHPFVITQGRVSVYKLDGTVEELVAPYRGITPVGTRRVLIVHEDTVWTTFHPTTTTDIYELEHELYEGHTNHLLPDLHKGELEP